MSSITSARSPVIFAKISTMRPVTRSLFYKMDIKEIRRDNNVQLTFNGDSAKIHDPTEHLSSDCAITYRQGVHCELASSEAELRALPPCVMNQGVYFRLSPFLLASLLSGSSLKEPKCFKYVEIYGRN